MKTLTVTGASRPGRARALFVLLVLGLALAVLSGCSRAKPRLSAIPNDEVIGLEASDICRIMQDAGFNDPQILELGPGLRNALSSHGAAQIQIGSRTEAIMAVHKPFVHVSSRTRGTFVYDLNKTHQP